MSFLLPRATSRGGLPVVQHRVNCLAEVTFLHVNRSQKLPGGKSNLAHAHINVQNKFFNKNFQKAPEIGEYVKNSLSVTIYV